MQPILILATLGLGLLAATYSHAAENPEQIIQRSVAANEADWKEAPRYACMVEDETDDRGTKTYEEMMILGSPYERLVAINGKPLSASEQRKEEEKFQQMLAKRQNETQEQRQDRIAKYEKERKRDHILMQQLTKAFNFRLRGEQKLGNRDVYVLDATPKPGYKPPNMEAKVLTGMKGELWIDKNEFQWVKVEAETFRPVSISGFLARVDPGTRFELEKAPVAPGVWLPKHFEMESHAKIVFLFHEDKSESETYSNCHIQGSIGKEEALARQYPLLR